MQAFQPLPSAMTYAASLLSSAVNEALAYKIAEDQIPHNGKLGCEEYTLAKKHNNVKDTMLK